MSGEYLSMFIDETREHLQAWSDGLLELEQTHDSAEVPIIFRAAHTIKGMAMTMGFSRMGELTHGAENLLDGIRQGTISVDVKIIDILFKSLDLLEQLLDGIEATGAEPDIHTLTVAQAIERLAQGQDALTETSATLEATVKPKTVSYEENPVQFVANQAILQGNRVFEINLNFEEGCQMPMARWAQVLQQVNQNELLYTKPHAAVLERDTYRGPIQFVIATSQDVEDLGKAIVSVSEVIVESIHEWTQTAEASSRGNNLLPETNLTSAPHVVEVVRAALQKGVSVYEAGVRLNVDAAMKGARLFMVFEAVGGQDQLLFTQPTMQDIEQEQIDTDVLFVLWSHDEMDKIRHAIEQVSDIELVELRQWREESGEPKRGENEVVASKDVRKVTRKVASTVRVDTDKLDSLMNLFSELVIDKTRLEKIEAELGNDELSQTVAHMSRVANELQEIVMGIRMVPVATVFTRFPRMVRDTALKINKEVDFEIVGESTELDRTVVEEIGDPIMHMLRNSLDHGIESADIRRRSGKPEKGRIVLRAYSAGNSVFIEVEDDGGGIDSRAVIDKAIRQGIVEAGTTMTDEEAYQLLFASGFSTSETVTDLSGRGVGLDVVKSKIEALSGRVEIQSEAGVGTKFVIQLPMTLAIMQGLMVSVDENPYLLPLASVAQVEEGVSTKLLGGKEVTRWRDEVVPLVRVRDVFGVEEQCDGYTVFVRRGNKTIGVVVDDVLGQQEVVLKALDKRLRAVKWLSGATILGDGTVALILDSNSFF